MTQNNQKHVFLGLTKNTEKHCYHLDAGAACSALLLYPYAIATTANLSLLLLFTAIVNVLTLLLFAPMESAIMTLMPYKECTIYEKVVTAKAASHHEFHAIQ